MLYIVGKNISGANASKRAANQKIIRIIPGVYCDPDDLKDVDEFVRHNALRITHKIVPDAALSHASAYLRGPVKGTITDITPDLESTTGIETQAQTRDGYKIFVAGTHVLTKKIEISNGSKSTFLHIVHSDDMRNDNTKRAGSVYPVARIPDGHEDYLGELNMLCSSDELTFIQQFGRKRGNLERFLDEAQLSRLYQSLFDAHGANLGDVLTTIVGGVDNFKQDLDRALNYIKIKQAGNVEERKLLHDFKVAWNGRHVANLQHDGISWHFDFNEGWVLPLSFQQRLPGSIPAFIVNLFPEGWMHEQVKTMLGRDAVILSQSERYLSNIAIVADQDRISSIPDDVMVGRLRDFSKDDVFEGEISGLPKIDENFINQLGTLVRNKAVPRISGTQMKMPMHLDADGRISPSVESGFTHILKLPGHTNDRYGARGAVEWACMRMARAGGVATCEFAMVDMKSMEPAYITERFDIRTGEEDFRSIFSEDLCSVSGSGPFAKYTGSMEQAAEKVLKHSTSAEEDARQILRMNVVSWLVENGDFHLKNLSLVKVAAPQLDRFRSVRLSPAYDIMSTKYFPVFPTPPEDFETLALSVNGKQDGFTVDDFVSFGQKMGIPEAESREIVIDTCSGLARESLRIQKDMPACITAFPAVDGIVMKVCERAIEQIERLAPDVLNEIDSNPVRSAGRGMAIA